MRCHLNNTLLCYKFTKDKTQAMKAPKVQAAFRFDKELTELVKEKAKAQHKSLNNNIEFLLLI